MNVTVRRPSLIAMARDRRERNTWLRIMGVKNNAGKTPGPNGRGLVRVRVRTTVRTRVRVMAVPCAARVVRVLSGPRAPVSVNYCY